MSRPNIWPRENVFLLIDDFLASGQTILGLARLASVAGATMVGVGTLVEKTFECGREVLAELNVPVESLVAVSDMSDGKIIFAE